MSEDVKPRKFWISESLIAREPTLQLMKEMGEVIRGHDCLKGSAYFDGEDRTITECTSCDVLEKYRKFLEGIEK